METLYDSLNWLEQAKGLNGMILTVAGIAVLAAIAAYFLGCFNGAVIVSKYILRDDVRTHGSGNAGLTNFYRTFGGPLTLVVILCDVVKAILAVLLGAWLFGSVLGQGAPLWVVLGKYWAGLFCMVGHMFPCMFKFKGGKGILSGGTIAWMIDWRLALVCWGGFLILAILTKWVSLGSLSTGVTFPLMTWVLYQQWIIFILGLIVGGLIIWKHESNLKRILRGEESKFSFRRKKE